MAFLFLSVCASSADAQECDSAHAPTTVVYSEAGGTSQATVLSPASDGVVHAVDAGTGAPLWSFTAPELAAASRHSGLITDIRVLRFDADNDGTIDVSRGDKVWLYFGLRKAGAFYYALDITERARPRVLWKMGAAALDHLGDAWSTPTVARVRVAGAAQNGEHFVLVFGGGHDNSDSVGNRIFMVDAATGQLLWFAGANDSARAPDLVLDDMSHSAPARVAVIDTDGDGFTDRMYAVDVSGVIWRFDIWNGQRRSSLVTGGVLADLSAEASSEASTAGVAQFFNAPDVSLIQPRGRSPYYNVAVGSSDAFYAIRDNAPFARRTQSEYRSAAPIVVSQLVDIASASGASAGSGIPPDAPGWRLSLNAGESVVGESVTATGVVLFETAQLSSSGSGALGACTVVSAHVYAIRVDTATAGLDFNDDGDITAADLSQALPQSVVPAELSIDVGSSGANHAGEGGSGTTGGGGVDGNSGSAASASPTHCRVGSYELPKCVSADVLLRTYWQRPSVK